MDLKAIQSILEQQRGKRHLIVLHSFPDPDAIASAFAQQLISRMYEIESDIIFSGEVSHQQNVALVKLLGIDMIQFTESLDLSQYSGAIFIDNQGVNAEPVTTAVEEAELPILMIIDHHEPQERLTADYVDNSRAGSVSTKYADMINKGLFELDEANRSHRLAATALMHGIIADTNNFLSADRRDFGAAGFLSQFAETDLLSKILQQARSKQTMDIIYKALGNRDVIDGYSIAGIGYLRTSDRDAVPQAADFLLTESNVHTAIVYGIMRGDDSDERLVGSLRTMRLVFDPDGFLKKVFGQSQAGRYYGGGKMGAGGFQIPLGFLAGDVNDDYRDAKWQIFNQQVKQKLYAEIGVADE